MDVVVWLGAPDPEMEACERLALRHGATPVYALAADGRRVHPGNAYEATGIAYPHGPVPMHGIHIMVECDVAAGSLAAQVLDEARDGGPRVRCDHHRPGDRGYGAPPSRAVEASSLHQLGTALQGLAALPPRPCACGVEARELTWLTHGGADCAGCGLRVLDAPLTHEECVIAACDHALAAAYAGVVPDIAPEEVLAHRIASRAAFQRRDVGDVARDQAAAVAAIRAAPEYVLDAGYVGCYTPCTVCEADCGCAVYDPPRPRVVVRDLRGLPGGTVPEAAEAAAQIGVAVLYRTAPTAREPRAKVGIIGDIHGDAVRAFLDGGGARLGLVGLYGDPARGYAGGYVEAGVPQGGPAFI